MIDDTTAMQAAIAASHEALQRGDMPFGAALVKDGALLQVSGNTQCSTADGMAHAEVELLRVAQRKLGAAALRGATVFASGEPCAMCCGTMFWAGISRVVFAASQADIAEALGGPTLPITSAAVFAGSQPAVQVDGPLMREEARAVLQAFAKRHAAVH
jgi:tRNA(adenine34) deaminase